MCENDHLQQYRPNISRIFLFASDLFPKTYCKNVTQFQMELLKDKI